MSDWQNNIDEGSVPGGSLPDLAARAASDFNERTWLEWLIKVRIIIITFLFGIELAITNLTTTAVNKRAFIVVTLFCYTISVFFAVLLSAWREIRFQPRIQVLTDLGLATALVYITGGIDSSFNFLFPLIIIIGSILLSRSWAYMVAALAFICHGGMLELSYFDVIKSYSIARPDLRSLQATIFINFFAYLAIAYLASRLSAKLRQVDVQLKDKSGALENLQALHENIIHSISSGLITTGLDGRVRLVNAAAENLLGRTAGELFAQPVAQLFLDRLPQPGPEAADGEVRAAITNAKHLQKTFGVTASILNVPGSGNVGYIYTFDDLTEIRRLEREVRLRDRLAAVGRMAAGIAHEIRNPLSSIAGSVKVLSEVAVLSQEQHMLVDIVTRESERLNNIISDFLTYTREKQYEFDQVNLASMLDETLTLFENRLPMLALHGSDAPPNVEIIRKFDVQDAPTIADRDRLKQVFWNICENAARAMPEGGKLTVTLSSADDQWLVSFADTGPGMKVASLEKIFEPFQSEFAGGTGLGLAIVYQIVQAHDGKISVRSAPGEGAEFLLRLKRSAANQAASGLDRKRQPAAAAAAAGEGNHG